MALRLHALPPVDEWSPAEVGDWLEVLGLDRLRNQFTEEQISGQALVVLTETDLREQLKLPLGDVRLLANEIKALKDAAVLKRKRRMPLVQPKGQLGKGEPLSPRTRKRVRDFSCDGVRRAQPLTEEELECWDHQASWLRCAVTGVAWPRDDGSFIGMALYHQPRYCTELELRRRQLEEQHAARRKAEAASAAAASQVKTSEPMEAKAPEEGEWCVVSARASGGQSPSAEPDEGVQGAMPGSGGFVGRNNKGEVGIGDDYDREFSVYPDVEPPMQSHLAPISAEAQARLGFIEVLVGPVFDVKAFNRGASGGEGTLGLGDRGVVCLDRQYNAVNFQFFVQRHPNSFARRLCTSRLSFYIEEGHGKRVFPLNILSQLSLLFFRTNNRLYDSNKRPLQAPIADCIMRAIPKILLQVVLEIIQGTGFDQYMEHAVRLYLLVHHTAIKLLAYFPRAHQLVYDRVIEWVQNPFYAEAVWGPEEAMLAASLVSVPFSVLREPLVRRVLADMQGGADASCAVLLKQNREVLERLSFVQSFFEAGPGRLTVRDLEAKYTRCAGTLPKQEREQLLKAVREAGVESCEDWWRIAGMDGICMSDEQCSKHLLALREHVLAKVPQWRQAAPLKAQVSQSSSEALGAEELGEQRQAGAWMSNQQKRLQRLKEQEAKLAEARAMHEGYPKLVNGGLDSKTCLYCQQTFASKGALFRHLNKMIPGPRMIYNWHQDHFRATITRETWTQAPLRCPARCCKEKMFEDIDTLQAHLVEMGVPGAEAAALAEDSEAAGVAESDAEQPLEEVEDAAASIEVTVVDPHVRLGLCFACQAARDTLLAQCGHVVACSKCAAGLESCPVCSTEVTRRIQVCWS
mmetsp:Transcript_116529/g.324760  ORF Transcript_116529/g.324760 Transcript_116529/m.324760 type:complete len:859 (-) Transcript_116529:101-2677(-)